MGRVETFDHTADLGLRVHGESLSDLFQAAAEGLFDVILANRAEVCQEVAQAIHLSADSTSELLVKWLNELIYRSETEHVFYGRFEVEVDADGRALSATIWGEAVNPQRHVLDHEVKAATHHGLSLRPEGQEWLAEVILDI
jgi:SHS2 domain-containing protein